MNIMAKLTLRHLRENMKRTIVTILGIVMATALITAILLGVFSAFHFFGYVTQMADGDIHMASMDVTKEQYNELREDKRIKYTGLVDTDPNTSGIRVDADAEIRFRVGNILNANQEYMLAKVSGQYEGTLPCNSSEIAVRQEFLDDNGLDLSIGDTLTFELGNRYSYDEDGTRLYWSGNYRSEESFETLEIVTCTITAIVIYDRPTRGYDILRGLDEGYYPDADHTMVTVTLKKCDHTANIQLDDIISKYGLGKCSKNSEYLISNLAFEGSAEAYLKFFSVMLIGLAIVVVTSVILIVNSFGMSLAERMKYLGMLASVGATGRQKRFSVYFEGFILGVIGIPLGLLAGVIGTYITLYVLGSRIIASNMIVDAEGLTGGIPLVASPIVIFAIIVVSALTILISLLVPALRAAKVMPVDALRQTGTIKVRAGKLRINPFIRKIFGYEGELAYKNIKRNGFKSKVISASITISIIMFLTIDYFCDTTDKINRYDFNTPYQVYAAVNYSEKEKLLEDLSGMDDIDRVYTTDMIVFPLKQRYDSSGKPMYLTLANADIADPSFRTTEFKNLDLKTINVTYVDDDVFRDLLEMNGLDPERYFGDTLRGVLVNSYFNKTNDKPVFNESMVGQVLHYDEPMGNPPAVEVGDLIPYRNGNFAYELVQKETMVLIVPESMYFARATETLSDFSQIITFGIMTGKPAEVETRLEELFAQGEYEYYFSGDMTQYLAIMNTVTLILKTSMYGFTILLTLIAVANIINTISTGVLLRRKEFAMYRSVGMDEHGFTKMIRLETFLYGIKAVLVGIPVSILLCYLMYQRLEEHLFAFVPNIEMYPVVVVVVFGVIGLSMLMSINKIKNDEIIDVLKEDIC